MGLVRGSMRWVDFGEDRRSALVNLQFPKGVSL